MARLPHYQANVRELGKLLARARIDPGFRSEFMADPKKMLSEIGLPETVIALMNFKIIDGQEADTVVIPYRLNQKRLSNRDPEYLASIGREYMALN